jgi:F0F1-type ATP synthase membrane subunit b/b'
MVAGNNRNLPDIDTSGIPEDRQKYIEFGIAATQKTVAERDEAWAEVTKLNQQVIALKTEIASLQALSGAMESRATSYQNSRDEAVAQRAEYEVLLRSISAQLREFNIKHEPIIKEIRDRRNGDDA